FTETGEDEAVEGSSAAIRALRIVGGVAAQDLLVEALLTKLRDQRRGFGAEAGVVDHRRLEGAQVVDLGREIDVVGGEVENYRLTAEFGEGVLEEAREADTVVVVLLPEDRYA